MKFTLSWLKSHLDTDAPTATIADKLTALGLEVESLHDPAAGLQDFIVAHVLEAKPHPNADRLRLCTVNTGSETIQVVCGAPNARTGMKAVLARPGVKIPATGEVLKKGAIRGVESQGMLCSTRELNLGDDRDGIIDLPENAPVGAPVTQVLALDPVFEINLTPNRVDALGVRGVARDLAAGGLGTLKALQHSPLPGRFDSPRSVAMMLPPEHAAKCPQFIGRTIRGVTNGESPAWLKDRLSAVGLRPVSALVDITQYITIDLGRPLHVFDDAKLSGDVGPRLAREGETVAALNGKTYTLDGDMVVIADDAAALGIGGVMGGEPSSVTAATTAVFIESALFDPLNIAATGRKLQITSDARYCFERGVDPASADLGAELATRMILDICGGEPSHLVAGGGTPEWRRAIAFPPDKVKTLGGVDMNAGEIRQILVRLGFAVDDQAVVWSVSPPSWRSDVHTWQDVVEDVIRVAGYDAIPATPLPRAPMPRPVLTPLQRLTGFVRRSLAARGLNETVTWSFMAAANARLFADAQATVAIANPISADLDALRPSAVPNLIAAAGRNAARGEPDVALFEIGPRFEGGAPGQQILVAAGLRAGQSGPRHWAGARRPVDAMDAKADALAALEAAGAAMTGLQTGVGAAGGVPRWYHPGRSGALKLGNQVLATFGEVHPRVLAALDVAGPITAFEVFLERLPPQRKKASAARALLKASDLQPVERDFAFVVDATVSAETLLRAVRGADRELIADASVFDVYDGASLGAGKKSLAIAVTLQPKTATLTDAEIEAVAAKIVAAAIKTTGGALRG